MDPTIITACVMTVLMPLLKKSSEAFAGEAGKLVSEKAKNLFATLKSKLSGDKFAGETLSRFENDPERYQAYIEDILKEKLAQDKALAGELVKIINDIKNIGPTVAVVMKIKEAEEVVGLKVKEMAPGTTVKIEQDVEKVKKITGMEANHIGYTE